VHRRHAAVLLAAPAAEVGEDINATTTDIFVGIVTNVIKGVVMSQEPLETTEPVELHQADTPEAFPTDSAAAEAEEAIDKFLDDPSTGTRRTRPEREGE
jgi:hypothetical protein